MTNINYKKGMLVKKNYGVIRRYFTRVVSS